MTSNYRLILAQAEAFKKRKADVKPSVITTIPKPKLIKAPKPFNGLRVA